MTNPWTWEVTVGTDAAAAAYTLVGATIRHGRTVWYSQPDPSTLVAVLLADAAAVPALQDTVQVDAVIGATRSRRFTGRIVAIDYTPGNLQITAMGALEILNRAFIGDTPWPQEDDTTRLGRILDLGQVTKSIEGVSRAVFLPRDVDRRNAGELGRAYASQAGGMLVDSRDWIVRYITADRLSKPAKTVTLPPSTVLAGDYQGSLDAGGVVNQVSVAYGLPVATPQPDGSTAMIQPTADLSDAASVAAYGARYERINTDYAQLTDAQELAASYVANRATPRWQLPSATIELALVDPATVAAMASVDVADLARLPAPAHAPWTEYLGMVQGWVETIGTKSWQITLDVVRADTTPLGTVVWQEPTAGYVWSKQALQWRQAVTLAQLTP